MKRATITKKISSFLLSISMLAALMPVNPALAADNEYTFENYPPVYVDKWDDSKAAEKLNGRTEAAIFTLDTDTGITTEDGKSVIRLDISAYGFNNMNSIFTTLNYDKNVVEPCLSTGEDYFILTADAVMEELGNHVAVVPNEYLGEKYQNKDITWNYKNAKLFTFNEMETTIDETESYLRINMFLGVASTVGSATFRQIFNMINEGGNGITLGDKKVKFLSAYFKTSDLSKITRETFTLNSTANNSVNPIGSTFARYESNRVHNLPSVSVFENFPKPAAQERSVTFAGIKGEGGTQINAGSLRVYEIGESGEKTEIAGSPFTITNGGATVSGVYDYKTYSYEITHADYQKYTSEFEVNEKDVTIEDVMLNSKANARYPITFTVKDADTDEVLPNVTVKVGEETCITGADGKARAELTAGSHTYAVSGYAGYQDLASVSFEVTQDPTDETSATVPGYDLALTPERVTTALQVPHDSENQPIVGATVTVRKISTNKTNAWGDSAVYTVNESGNLTQNAKLRAGSSEAQLPKNTKFEVTFAADGYSSSTVYAQTDDTSATYYGSYDGTTMSEQIATEQMSEKAQLTAADAPVYTVEISQGEGAASDTYTAKVKLKNIKSTYGAFGLRYDSEVFELVEDGFKLSDELEKWETTAVSSINGEYAYPSVSENVGADVGYHSFAWIAKDLGAGFDASKGKEFATYTFKRKADKKEEDVSQDAFTVMEFDKTNTALDYITHAGSYDAAYESFLSEFWRYTDAENEKEELPAGRLSVEEATNKGFHQVYAIDSSVAGIPEEGMLCDVKTEIKYMNFQAKKAQLTIEVTDIDKIPVDGYAVNLYTSDAYDEEGKLKSKAEPIRTATSDKDGIVTFDVDTTDGDVTYGYTITKSGFYDYPSGTEEYGKLDAQVANKEVKVTTIPQQDDPKASITEYVTLLTSVYHPVKLKDKTTDADIAEDVAKITGGDVAYNKKDYLFNIKAVGKVYDTTKPVTVVTEKETFEITFDVKVNAYVIPGEKITGEGSGEATENGFQSSDIIIKIDPNDMQNDDRTYTVTAQTNAHGTVAYTKPDSAGADIISEETVAAQASPIVFTGIEAGKSTGTFTIAPEAGYEVEKVFINGVQVDKYNGSEESVEYAFRNITMDSDITVLFGKEGERSEEAVVTIVVGEKGNAEISAPTGITDELTNTRKTIVMPEGGTLAFTATADSGYALNSVTKNNEKVENTGTAGAYSLDIAKGETTVVRVSFRESTAEDTFTVFVESYIAAGNGMIEPIGQLIYNLGDAPEFAMTPDEGWVVSGVTVDGREKEQEESEYKLNPLEKDSRIGANFSEKTYAVTGIVDLAQGLHGANMLGGTNTLSGAQVMFKRQSDGEEIKVTTDNVREGAHFDIDVPVGVWDIIVTKQGYLNYTITGYEIKGLQTKYYVGAADDTATADTDPAAKAIVPIIGETSGKGIAVAPKDVGVVSNAMRSQVSAAVKAKGNVDDSEDKAASVDDMAYLKHNFGSRNIEQSYAEFRTENPYEMTK